ncbi:patatin-like phospholipase family protein [Mesonia aestuariivivens]|uniref:Patatin-like phospholipase family protein n=1 Tax=Mesonia aestuariivivens TaxID=2796128 RepID=A0ABS6VXM0_9FLAO|nr:patatin-like phospholipase family protein [Mesonia aestuariivivens]MBW2960330.1 patatin-like phospholipase family protein [Mesonia aestuariivivens]
MKKIFRLLFLLLGMLAFSQAKAQSEDLKVGLVLSGGGAKGLAHIGALKIIKESGVRIDYIGGTSMGAIIGSLYASGYSPEQLDSIFKLTNFNKLIQDELPREVKSFNEKKDAERYAIALPFKNFKLSFPSGLSKGQNLYNLMMQLTTPVAQIEDFSKLPIPFFCIGTNIETGKEVVLDHGSLARSVAASGSIPSLFSPVEINGQLITDGGVTNNYPIDEIKKRGIDYVIGVDVQDSLADRTQLQTAFEILTQINNFRTIHAMEGKRQKTDLYIKPNIKDFSILSFDQGSAIIKEGELETEKFLDELKKITQRQLKSSVEKEKLMLTDSIYIGQIHINGNNNYPRNYIRGKLKIDSDTKISYRELNRGINNLSATGNFKKIEYKLSPKRGGKSNLVLTIHENEINTWVRGALHYDELYKSAALVNFTQKSLFLKNDITSVDLVAGDNFRYNFSYYIDKGSYWSIGLNSRYNEFKQGVPFNFVEDNFNLGDFNVNKVEVEYSDLTNQFYVETYFVKEFKFGLGGEHKYTKLETETIVENENNQEFPVTILEQSNLFSAFGYLEYDKYDNAYFPAHGAHFKGDFHWYLLDSKSSFGFEPFSILKGSAGYAFSPLHKFSLRIQSETGIRFGDSKMNGLDFFLGGYGNRFINNVKPLLGYDFLSISGDSYVKSLVEIDYEVFSKNHIIASYNVANVEDGLYSSGNVFSLPDYTGVALGYGIETLLGPIEVKYSYAPELSESQWFFSLGFWF